MNKHSRWHKKLGFIKEIDMFAIPVCYMMNFERHDYHKNKTSHSGSLGSYIGGIFTIIMTIFFFTYTITLITNMESGSLDLLKNILISNPLGTDEGKNNLDLKAYKFLPIVEIYPTAGKDD